jgi:predicted outer membrane repeat protein
MADLRRGFGDNLRMRRTLLAVLLVVSGCSSDSGHNDDAATAPSDGGAPRDLGPIPDVGPVMPPSATCGAPIMPVDTTHADHVVGTGTAASCTLDALRAAITMGGTITFSCGGDATIMVTTELTVPTDRDVTIDGGNHVTLDGGSVSRILSLNSANYRHNTHVLTLQHLTLRNGHVSGTMPYATAPAPCSQGFYDGFGGAVFVRDGTLHVFDCDFESNQAEALGPDVGGGAISLNGALGAVVSGSTFRTNRASNGGAIQVLNSDLDVYDSAFDANVAEGHGANGDDMTMCSVMAMTHQYQTGSGGNGGAIVIDGGSDGMHTFCGVTFHANVGGDAALGGAIFRTPDGATQTTVIDRCTFDSNTSPHGGALYFHNSTLSIRASTFHANVAATGCGAIQSDGSHFDFVNDTFEGNVATAGLGGAVCSFGGDGTIAFTTFANNHADGGDPYFGAALAGNPTLTLTSDLFVQNTARNAGAPMQCMSHGTGDGDLQFPGTHVVGGAMDALCTPTTTIADPMLGAIGNHGGPTATLLPASGSPAIGHGVSCPSFDQRGTARPASGCTSGAVEGSM